MRQKLDTRIAAYTPVVLSVFRIIFGLLVGCATAKLRQPEHLEMPNGKVDLHRAQRWPAGLATTDRLGAPVYFCDSRSSWQRGTNEKTN